MENEPAAEELLRNVDRTRIPECFTEVIHILCQGGCKGDRDRRLAVPVISVPLYLTAESTAVRLDGCVDSGVIAFAIDKRSVDAFGAGVHWQCGDLPDGCDDGSGLGADGGGMIAGTSRAYAGKGLVSVDMDG